MPLLDDSAYVEWFQTMRRIGDKLKTPADAPLTWKSRMEKAGFEDVQEHVFKVPANPWPKDLRLKKIGVLELVNFDEGAKRFIMRGFTQVLGTKEGAEILIARARSAVRNGHVHSYLLV